MGITQDELMQTETLEIRDNNSARSELSGLILSVRYTLGKQCDFVVGYPGLPNAEARFSTGDALLFETPHTGIFEVRLLSQNAVTATFLVTHVAPRPGFGGALDTSDPNNAPFTPEELKRIEQSVEVVKSNLQSQGTLLPEQLALINRKLDEIVGASSRLGRKDWINYVAGAITSVCASAAFAPETTKSIFIAINSAFSWLFGNALSFIQ